MIEVFKTNVEESSQAASLVMLLQRAVPGSKVNFDLDDCDRVLRVEGHGFAAPGIVSLVVAQGFECSVLE